MRRGARAGACALVAALATSLVGVAGCGGGAGTGTTAGGKAGAGTNVAVADFSFTPKRLEVRPGQTVRWTNEGQTEHTVKGPGFFTPSALGHGQSYSHRFMKAGSYPYLCTLHPPLMKGVVVVG